MPFTARRRRYRKRPYAKRSYAYKKRRQYRKRYKRYARKVNRTKSIKSRMMVQKSYIWRPVGQVQSFTPGLTLHPWGTSIVPLVVQMDQIGDYQALMNTWNYYKLCKAIWFFHVPGNGAIPTGTFAVAPPGGSLTAGSSPPWIGSYIDPDGLNATTTETLLREEPSHRIWKMRPGMQKKRAWKPSFLVPAYRAGATNAYRPQKGWITQSYVNVPHYGLVFDWVQGLSSSVNIPVYWQVWVLIGLKQLDTGKPMMSV